jgi:hypothetical protein
MIVEVPAPRKFLRNQGSNVEFTVAQKLHHGTIPQSGCYRLRGSFFARPDDRSDGVTFLDKQKSDKQKQQATMYS